MQVKNLYIETKKGRKLIDDLSFSLNDNDKIAVIGEEGNGKSTLLKAIYNKDLISDFAVVKGQIINNKRIGFLEQKLNEFWDNLTILDFFTKETAEGEINYDVYSKIHELKALFKKYQLNEDYLEIDFLIKNLSGGEKVKIQLIKLDFYDYDIYFLDEPTNDLDIETLEFLESFMKQTSKPILFISHDQTLLENVANQILHIEELKRKQEPRHNLEKCGYKEYVIKRKRKIEHQTEIALNERRELKKQQQILKEIKDKVQQAIYDACRNPNEGRILVKKMKNILSQEKRFENQELTEIPEQEEAIKLIMDESVSLYKSRVVLDLNLPVLKIDNIILANNITLKVMGNEKLVITGKNGSGKSTLIKVIKDLLAKDKGLKVGYFSQNYSECLNYENIVSEEIESIKSGLNSRTVLSTLKFTQEEIGHKIQDLSEGQKAKVLILKLMLEKNNVLVLDEPTRNLSPLSSPEYRNMLKSFKGAIISVSHDRKFIDEVCDKVYELSVNGLKIK